MEKESASATFSEINKPWIVKLRRFVARPDLLKLHGLHYIVKAYKLIGQKLVWVGKVIFWVGVGLYGNILGRFSLVWVGASFNKGQYQRIERQLSSFWELIVHLDQIKDRVNAVGQKVNEWKRQSTRYDDKITTRHDWFHFQLKRIACGLFFKLWAGNIDLLINYSWGFMRSLVG